MLYNRALGNVCIIASNKVVLNWLIRYFTSDHQTLQFLSNKYINHDIVSLCFKVLQSRGLSLCPE